MFKNVNEKNGSERSVELSYIVSSEMFRVCVCVYICVCSSTGIFDVTMYTLCAHNHSGISPADIQVHDFGEFGQVASNRQSIYMK